MHGSTIRRFFFFKEFVKVKEKVEKIKFEEKTK